MCEIEKRAEPFMLSAALAVVLVNAGVAVDKVEAITDDLVKVIAKNSMSHPCWAVEVLGLQDEDKTKEELDSLMKQVTPDLSIGVVKIGPDGVETNVGIGDLPPELKGAVSNFISAIKARRESGNETAAENKTDAGK